MPALARRLHSRGSESRLPRVAALVAVVWLAGGAWDLSFVGGASPLTRQTGVRSGTPLQAEAKEQSVALVKVTEENKITTASVLGGLAGLLVGGVWVGAGLFAAGAYLARKEDDDISKALKGVAAGSMEVLNFGAYLNDKYTVTDRLGGAISGALDSAKSSSSGSKDSVESATSLIDGAVDAIKAADREVDFKASLGSLASSASDLASQAVGRAVELNQQYKVTDQISEKLNEAVSSAQTTSSSKAAGSSSN